jgi:DNA-binding HxlR family transcriptional regulator
MAPTARPLAICWASSTMSASPSGGPGAAPRRPTLAAAAADSHLHYRTHWGKMARMNRAAAHIRASLVNDVLDLIGDRWTLALVGALAAGPRRFEGLQAALGIARSTLAQRLADLVADGIAARRAYSRRPPRYEYALTRKGAAMRPILDGIAAWDAQWRRAGGGSGAARRLVCAHCGGAVHARDVAYEAGPGASARLRAPGRRGRRQRPGAAESARNGGRAPVPSGAVDILGDRPSALIVAAAFFGLRRFRDIEQALELAPNVLARRLERLVAGGFLARDRYLDRPPRWQYLLTEKGLDLYPLTVAQIAWADRHLAPKAGPPLLLTHRPCGKRLKLALREHAAPQRAGQGMLAL